MTGHEALVAGRYRPERRAAGRLGDAWEAVDEHGAGRRVCVTLLEAPRDARAATALAERLDRLRAAHDPGLAPVLDADPRADPPYVVTPLLEHAAPLPGRLDPVGLRAVVLQVLAALSALHEAGVPHGALGAGSIVLDGGRAVLLDAGVGGGGRSDGALPATDGRRDDLEALGTLAARMASGHLAPAVPLRRVAPAFADADPALADVLDALRGPSATRPSAGAAALRLAAAGALVPAVTPPVPGAPAPAPPPAALATGAPPRAGRRRWVLAVAAVAAVVLVAAVAAVVLTGGGEDDAAGGDTAPRSLVPAPETDGATTAATAPTDTAAPLAAAIVAELERVAGPHDVVLDRLHDVVPTERTLRSARVAGQRLSDTAARVKVSANLLAVASPEEEAARDALVETLRAEQSFGEAAATLPDLPAGFDARAGVSLVRQARRVSTTAAALRQALVELGLSNPAGLDVRRTRGAATRIVEVGRRVQRERAERRAAERRAAEERRRREEERRAAAAQQATVPPFGAVYAGDFGAVDGLERCTVDDDQAFCVAAPSGKAVSLFANGEVRYEGTGWTRAESGPRTPMGTGFTTPGGRISCSSSSRGITCVANGTGNGFTIGDYRVRITEYGSERVY